MDKGDAPHSWLLLEKSDDTRVSAGLDGYIDVTGREYSYDSTVPNHAQLKVGDRIVTRLEDQIIGVGKIYSIGIGSKKKVNRRCPSCNATDIRERKEQKPRFRCGKCKNEFDMAFESFQTVTTYVAAIDDFAKFEHPGPSVREIKSLGVRSDGAPSSEFQHSMMKLDAAALDILLSTNTFQSRSRAIFDATATQLKALSDAQSSAGEYDPSDGRDSREKVLREINRRRGQPKFRKDLLVAYGERCAITGMDCPQALEAAHILPYRGDHTNHVKNGLLLRSDIHT